MLLAAIEFDNLHQILRALYDEMMPLCSNMTGVAKGIAGLGGFVLRGGKSVAVARTCRTYRRVPASASLCAGAVYHVFPTFVLGTINTVLSPVVRGCNDLLQTQTFDMNEYRQQKDKLEYEALMRNPETAYIASDEEFDRQLEELGWSPSGMITMTGMYMDRAAYDIKKSVRDWFRELLELMFQAAALIIDTLRTFFLIVLSILGPLAFAISVYDGFQSTLPQWITRYISIYLWLPVADLFSSVLARIQTLMLQRDIEELSDPNFIPDGSNSVYIIFMIIGIVGYFTIPTVAGWIVSAGGTSGYNRNITKAGVLAGAAAGAATGKIAGKLLK